MPRSAPCLPVTNTISHDITSTTPVRMAVPRFDSTPEMPTLPRMAVRLANTAEPSAYHSHAALFVSPVLSFFSIIRNVPAAMSTTPIPFVRLTPSRRKIAASRIVSTVLDLSIGTTLFTSPSWSALK